MELSNEQIFNRIKSKSKKVNLNYLINKILTTKKLTIQKTPSTKELSKAQKKEIAPIALDTYP